jgi:HK97 family phage major capsid protein
MSAKRRTFSGATEAAISGATTAALNGTAPGVFATHRERIAATLASPMAAAMAGMPNAGIDANRVAAAVEDSAEAARLAIEAAKGAGEIAKRADQRASEVQANLQAAEQKLAMLETGSTGIVAYRSPSIGASLVQRIESGEADAFNALREGNTTKARARLETSIRAALTHNGGSSSETGYPSQPETGAAYGGPVRRLTLLEALPSRSTTRDAVEFVRITADDNADVQFPEGTEKAEIDLEGELVRAEIATVAAHTSASKQVLSDAEALAAVVDRILRGKVSSKAEAELVTGAGGPGHVEGLLTQAPTFVPSIATEPADIIGECLASMADDGYTVGFVLLNPLDWFELQTERATPSGEYLFGSPAAPIAPSLWNRPVVLSSSVPRGSGVAVDTSCATVLDRQQVTVEASEHHGTNFTKNLVTIRAEARIGLEVSDQWGVRKFDLSTSS